MVFPSTLPGTDGRVGSEKAGEFIGFLQLYQVPHNVSLRPSSSWAQGKGNPDNREQPERSRQP